MKRAGLVLLLTTFAARADEAPARTSVHVDVASLNVVVDPKAVNRRPPLPQPDDGAPSRQWLMTTTDALLSEAGLWATASAPLTIHVRATVTHTVTCTRAYACDPIPGDPDGCRDACAAWEPRDELSGEWQLDDLPVSKFANAPTYANQIALLGAQRMGVRGLVKGLLKRDDLVWSRLTAVTTVDKNWGALPEAQALVPQLIRDYLAANQNSTQVLSQLHGWEKHPEAQALVPGLVKEVLLDYEHTSPQQNLLSSLAGQNWIQNAAVKAVVPALISALETDHFDTLLGASLVLQQLKDPRLEPPLCGLVQRRFSQAPAVEAVQVERSVWVTSGLHDPCSAAALDAVFMQPTFDAARAQALREGLKRVDALPKARQAKDPWSLTIVALLADEAEARTAVESLSSIEPHDTHRLAEFLFISAPLSVRQAAAKALKGAPADPFLKQAVVQGFGAWQDIEASAEFRHTLLELSAEQENTPFLASLVQHYVAPLRDELVPLLVPRVKDPVAAEALVTLAQNTSAPVAKTAEAALLSAPVELLRGILSEPDVAAPRALVALRVLTRKHDARSKGLARALLTHADPAVRATAKALVNQR